eukprot:280564-Chlamydomonas_euryale.AAC.1
MACIGDKRAYPSTRVDGVNPTHLVLKRQQQVGLRVGAGQVAVRARVLRRRLGHRLRRGHLRVCARAGAGERAAWQA